MKIYSDVITRLDVQAAFARAREHGADIWIEDIRTWNPRAVRYGTEIHGSSIYGKRLTNNGARVPAATWTDWGYAIAELYNTDPTDPDARVGIYQNEADFVAKVRQYQPRGASLAFLGALRNINSYGGTNG